MTNNHDPQLHHLERPQFFNGQLLLERDFQLLLHYPREKLRLIQRYIHGTGIVQGLLPEAPRQPGAHLELGVTPGLAIDALGRELIVAEAARYRAEGEPRGGLNYLFLRYREQAGEPMAGLDSERRDIEVCHHASVHETVSLVLTHQPPLIRDCVLKGLVLRKHHAHDEGHAQELDPLVGVKVQAIREGVVQATELSDEEGRFEMALPHGHYQVRITVPHGRGGTLRRLHLPPGTSELLEILIEPDEEAGQTAHDHACAHEPLEEQVQVHDVFLAAVVCFDDDRAPEIERAETLRHRRRVFSNPMLASLLLDHLNDPSLHHGHHHGGLGSLNGVAPAEPGGDLALVCPDKTLHINPCPKDGKIQIRVPPGKEVKPVHSASDPGRSHRFAREDHVHKLDPEAIESRHLAGLLTSSDGSIAIKSSKQAIDLRAATVPPPADTLGCIEGTASIGADGASRGRSEWISHPFGPKPICVQVGIEMLQDDLDSNDLLMGDLEALPDFKVFLGVTRAPRFAVRLDIQGSRFMIYAQNTGLRERRYTVHWWAFDHR